MRKSKIALIGAGSGCFSTSLISGICKIDPNSGSLFSLMDINEARLDAVHQMCVRLNELLGGNLRFEKTTNRAEALQDADFVINTALAASHTRLQAGFDIAKKHGFRFGGSYHVMYDEAFWINFYQLRLMEDITRDMRKYCPDAWHLLVANPVITATTYLQRKYPDIKMVGLCHGFEHVFDWAERIGFAKEDLTYQIPGVNHFVWLNEARVKGEPFFPMMEKWFAEHPEATEKPGYLKMFFDFYQKHGVYPIGDTMGWTGAAWPWWYHSSEEVENAWVGHDPQKGWDSYFETVNGRADDMIELAKGTQEEIDAFLNGITPDAFIVPLVDSLAGGKERVMTVNLLNKGQLVPGLPEDFEVEVQALCNGDGMHPIQTTPLPKHMIAHVLRDRVAPVEMELAAYESGDINLLRELVLMDKWATSMEQVSNFIDEILDLPYHEEMRNHYRGEK